MATPITADATFAKKRLVRDLKELQRESENLKTVSALPTHDLLEWHCNLRPDEGPYAGTIFHLVLKFKENYPKSPPEVYLCTAIDHPNVFEWTGTTDYFSHTHPYVCLDMLQEYYTRQPYVGWSSAYSVSSILLQLQSFLFAENVPQDYGGYEGASHNMNRISRAIRQARDFSCEILDVNDDVVVHEHRNPWPPLPKYTGKLGLSLSYVYGPNQSRSMASQKDQTKIVVVPRYQEATGVRSAFEAFEVDDEHFPALTPAVPSKVVAVPSPSPVTTIEAPNEPKVVSPTGKETNDFALKVPTSVYAHLFGFLAPRELLNARDVCSTWRKVIVTYNIFEKSQVSCFHTKTTLEDESAILGVGLNVKYYNGQGSALKEASSPLDILSFEAFYEQGVCTGVWGKEKFTHFLPLIFNQKHAFRAVPIIERTVLDIMKNVPPPPYAPKSDDGPARRFQPWMIFQLLSILMNTMVVQLMKDVEKNSTNGEKETVRRHASEKALEGYCAFHHILLYFARRYPSIEFMANKQVDTFISSTYNRHKRQTPNLGTLLVCLTLSKQGWTTLWKPLMLETFDRNVRWLLQKHPELGTNKPSGEERIRTTFYGTTTSLRLLMFQVHFMQHIGRPSGTRGPRDVLGRYDKRLGRPMTAQKEDLQAACKKILAVDRWNEFCDCCRVPLLTQENLVGMLEKAVLNSRRKRYHFDDLSDSSDALTASTTSNSSTNSSSRQIRGRGGPPRRR